MIKLLTPVDKVAEVEPLIDAGADEFFCGVLTADWHGKYIAGSINRRPGGGANFTTLEELESCVRIAHGRGIPVYLTLNEHYYTPVQYPFITDYLDRAESIGIDGMIVSDLAVLLTLRKRGFKPKIIVSIGGTVFNAETVRFYQELGAGRVILPRHLDLEEIRDICRNTSGIELETFILNSRCPNEDGFCTFQHGLADKSIMPLYQNACLLPYEITAATETDIDPARISWKRQHIWQTVHVDDHPCGACALYEFNELGIASVKIVGRGNPPDRKLKDVRFLRTLRDMLGTGPTQDEFREAAQKLYTSTYERSCRMYMCYYPEVIWNKQSLSPRPTT